MDNLIYFDYLNKDVSLKYDLQFFAKEGPGGEKTEQATPKKLDDARKEGQVAKSKDVASALSLFALFIFLKVWTGVMAGQFMELFGGIYNRFDELTTIYGGQVSVTNFTTLLSNCLVK